MMREEVLVCFVYWIYDHSCTDESLQGYVGVSHDPQKRHKTHIRKKRVPEQSDMKILFEGSREDCFEFERALRPSKCIGWNNAAGGSHGWRIGFKHDQSTKQKMREAWTDQRRKEAADLRKIVNTRLRGQKRPKQSEAMSGDRNPNYGKQRPKHVREAVSAAHRGKQSPNKQELYCISCRQRASFSILVKYHAKCFKRFCAAA